MLCSFTTLSPFGLYKIDHPYRHSSLVGDFEEDTQADPYNLFTLEPYDSLVPDY
jgi:hypothetical protein